MEGTLTHKRGYSYGKILTQLMYERRVWLPLPVNWRPPPPRQQSFLRPSTLGMVECVSFLGEHYRLGSWCAPCLQACSDPKNILGSGVWSCKEGCLVRTQPTHFQSYIFPPQSHISLDPIFQGGVLGQALEGRGGELSSRFQTSALSSVSPVSRPHDIQTLPKYHNKTHPREVS